MTEGYDIKASLSICLQTQDLVGYSAYLSNSKIRLNELKDSSGFNVFHDIANSTSKESLILLFLRVLVNEFNIKHPGNSEELIKQLLNTQGGKELFSPLNLAIRNNRKELCKTFIDLGADPCEKLQFGQNLAYLAAEKGCEYILLYLIREKNISWQAKDSLGRNALHAAALEGQTGAGLMLIAWTDSPDEVDLQENTALHLAIISGNYKIVRNLLIRGADPKKLNKNSQSPMDLAKDRGCKDISYLLSDSCKKKMNPFFMDFRRTKKKNFKFFSFVLFFFLRYAVLVVGMVREKLEVFAMVSAGFTLLSGFLFVWISCSNPGYVRKITGCGLDKLLEVYKSEYICFYCETRRSLNTRHCHICKKCVKVMSRQKLDHHCEWLNNCIGENNHFLFMLFIVSTFVDFVLQLLLALLVVITDYPENKNFALVKVHYENYITSFIIFINVCGVLFIGPLVLLHLKDSYKKKKPLVLEDLAEFKVNFESIEVSDTGSMMLKSASDWAPQSFLRKSPF